ncbi:dynein regulatory complex subunit 7 [Gastrophryne carolinensis]
MEDLDLDSDERRGSQESDHLSEEELQDIQEQIQVLDSSQIDHLLVPQSAVIDSKIYITAWSDRNPVMAVLDLLATTKHSYSWRLNDSLLSNGSTCSKIQVALQDYFTHNTNSVSSPISLWEAQKATMRGNIISIASAEKRERQRRIRDLTLKFEQAELHWRGNPSARNRRALDNLHSELNMLLDDQAEKRLRWSKQKFYTRGNKPDTMLTRKLRAADLDRRQPIKLKLDSGGVTADPDKVVSAFGDFLSTLYAAPANVNPTKLEEFFEGIELPNIEQGCVDRMEAPITPCEVLLAIKSLKTFKTPGPDGEAGTAPDDRSFPPSYRKHSLKERTLLGLADNFWRQYSHLYPDRKPLLLTPLNECGLKKFVGTTLHPTLLPYPELYHWEECARFVSQYLSMEPLDPPTHMPQHLVSSSTILRQQKGNCFDFSMLLCSLLLGGGYDAYCVNGYATREVCLMDESRKVCPLLEKAQESGGAPPERPQKKYSVRPPRQLVSRFEQQQETKRQAKIQAQRLQEEEGQAEAEKAGPDPLYGLRVHCWVLVLSGKREVPENFFIDALTGNAYKTQDERFLGIESVWNHQNYWVNMQDCRNGCKDVTFDLGDPVCWEFMLLGTSKPILLIPDMEDEDDEEEEEMESGNTDREIFQMPPSWTLPIIITPKEFETRSPQGKKLLQYRKSKLEKWAPYLQKDGLVARLTLYQDTECSRETQVQDYFLNRMDKLEVRQQSRETGLTTEQFSPGRSDSLKAHTYRSMAPETERTMLFYSKARLDGLERRDEKPKEIIETFRERDDFLCYRHAVFGKRPKKVAIAGGPTEANPRPILRITERFNRNPKKLANEDVAERVFLITEERINVRCHRQDDRISTSYWEFQKPDNLGEKGAHINLSAENCISYQVEPSEKCNKQLYIYETLFQLQQAELCAMTALRKSEAEVVEILSTRAKEESDPELSISIYDTERNEKSKEQRAALDRIAKEEQQRRAILELDYLAPFLARVGEVEKLSQTQALQVKEDCLSDLKQRLIEKANLIQARFEKETQELQKKQQWYQQNQLAMSKEDEDTYLEYCSEAMFRIQILESRLNRHRELAPQMYLALEDRLNKDPRLCEA